MSSQNDRVQRNLGRRNFLKVAIISGTAVATARIIKLLFSESLETALAIPGQGQYYYGTDTSWAVDTKGYNASDFPQNFYIGRTGVGELIYNDSSFYPDAADKAGKYYTHTYWCLKGPYYKYRQGRPPYDYGYAQGSIAGLAWWNHYYAAKIYGQTFFADIEEGTSDDPQSDYFDGWHYYDYIDVQSNRAVLEGFLDAVENYGFDFNTGIYTRKDLWEVWFNGTEYDPQRAYVVWLGGNACNFDCSPCDICTTAKSEADSKFHTIKETALGKYKTVIWQFFVDDCPNPDCADYDIARQNGYKNFISIKAVIYLPLIHKYYQQIKSTDQGAPNSYPPPPTPYP